jgi:hypothetical protein
MDIANASTRKDWVRNKNVKALNFYKETEMKEVDIIIDSPVQYPDASRDLVRVKAGKLTIPVISVKKLIRMKKDAGRPVDVFDLEMLGKINKIKRGAK